MNDNEALAITYAHEFMIFCSLTGTDLLVNLLTSLWTAEGKVQAGVTSLGKKLGVFFSTEDKRKN